MSEKGLTAEDIVHPAKAAKAGTKIQQYKVRLVKARARRYAVEQISSSRDLLAVTRMELGNLPHEEVIVIGLSGTNRPLGVVKVAQGGAHMAGFAPSDVVRPLVMMGAAAFVIAHNHPSGDANPSSADVHITRELHKAATCAGIHLLDHLIIANRGGGWVSLRDLNLIPT